MLKEFNEWLLTWKPIHLCWWFEKHNKPIPKYLIGGGATAPSVTTNAATSVTKFDGTLNGNVTSDGGSAITARGFVYSSTDTTPTIGEGGVTDTGDLTGTTGTYSHDIGSGLTANTTYYFQAYAINSKGTTYGGVQNFTTNAATSVALNTPADTATGVSTTPDLLFTGTDSDSLEIEYNVQVDTVNTFDSSPEICDSYSESNFSNGYFMYGGSISEVGQAFTGDGNKILSSMAYIKIQSGTPTGNMYANVYNITGTFGTDATPTGSAIATSDAVNVSVLTTSYSLVEFSFTGANQISLTNGTKYFITVEYSGGDTDNKISKGYDASSPTHNGNSASYNGSWSSSSIDDIFYVYTGQSPLLDKLSETPDATFSGTGDPHPWPSGNQVTYTVQAGDTLTASTQYYWRVRGKDPTGSDTYGSWATTRSFTTEAGGGGGNTRRYTLTTLGIG